MNDINATNTALAQELYKRNFELLQQRQRAEELLHSVSEAVITIDVNFHITLFNRVAEIMTQKKAEQVLNNHIDDVIHLETEKGEIIKAETYCFQEDPSKNIINGAVLVTPNTRFYVNLQSATLNPTQDFVECLITIADITKERILDNLKDEFLSVASHELRTPMTVIKSYLWMLMKGKGGELNEKQKAYITKAMNGAERLIALVNDMLNISQIEQGKIVIQIEEICLKKFFDTLCPEFKLKTDEKKIQLNLELDSELKPIYADKNKLSEILINLVGNSIKFTEKGTITIKAENTQDDFVKVQVIDTGKGIEQDDMDRLFHKFGRLDNSYRTVAESGGTGLGLYITKNLVETMGGEIGVHSDGPGKGSLFWFTIPTVPNKARIQTKTEVPAKSEKSFVMGLKKRLSFI